MRCLFVQLGRIGDLILLTPTFDALKSKFGAHLTLLTGPSNFNIINNHRSVDEIIALDKSPIKLPFILPKLLLTKYDCWIDPRDHLSKEGRFLASLSRAKRKIGYNPIGRGKVYTDSIPENIGNLHHVEIGLNALRPLGFDMPSQIPKPSLPLNEKSEQKISEITEQINGFTLLNISASKENKMWHDELWSKFIYMHRKSLEPLLICSSPQDRHRAEKINSDSGCRAGLFTSNNIADIVSLVNRAKILLTPDTSLVHIAAAFNKPVLALYSGLDEFFVKFRPLSDISVSVRANPGDSGIKSITLEEFSEAYNEISRLLS